MNLSRNEILKGKYYYPKGIINLKYTKHLFQRHKDRSNGLDAIPSVIRITPNNIHSGKSKNGKSLNSVVVKIKTYKGNMFICLNPFDSYVKTMWYGKSHYIHNR